MLSDTHPDAERVQIELLRQMTGAQRVATLRSHTALVIGLSRRAIAKSHPTLSDHEVNLLWVEYTYGREIAKRLRDYLENRR